MLSMRPTSKWRHKWKHLPCYWPFVVHRRIPLTKASNAELVFFDLRLNKMLCKQTKRRWFWVPWRSLWRHSDDGRKSFLHVCRLMMNFDVLFIFGRNKLMTRQCDCRYLIRRCAPVTPLWYFVPDVWATFHMMIASTVKSLYKTHLSWQLNCRSLRCSWSIACRRCSNYIFILDLIHCFNRLHGWGTTQRREWILDELRNRFCTIFATNSWHLALAIR